MILGTFSAAVVAVFLSLAPQHAQALKLSIHQHQRMPAPSQHLDNGRATADTLDLDSIYDLYYSTDLIIAGQTLSVQLDTGSSELWVRPKSPFTAQSSRPSNDSVPVRYGIGSFQGTLTTADVLLGDVTIAQQAFLEYQNGSIDNVFQAGLDGMLGLGFDDASDVAKKVRAKTHDDSGQTLRSNYFASHPEEPRTMSFVMTRNSDPTNTIDGLWMVGAPEPDYASVTTAPALPVHVNTDSIDFQRWSTYVDGIEVNGVNITGLTSVVAGAPSGKLVANMDTGTSLAWVPTAVVDAIYKDIPGAQYDSVADLYTVPCMSAPQVALWFGGIRYAIHPLDLSRVSKNAAGEFSCTNAFVHTKALSHQSTTLDMQLGDSFLRNAIVQYDFGQPSDHATANIRMVSTTTDGVAALNEFNTVRAKQIGVAAPPPVTQPPAAPPPGSSETSSATDDPVPTSPPAAGPNSDGGSQTAPAPNDPADAASPGDGGQTDTGGDSNAPPTNHQDGSAASGRITMSSALLIVVFSTLAALS